MYPANQSVWYRHPGSSFYILTNAVSSPMLFVQPSYYNPSDLNSYPLQRVIIDEVEHIEQGYHGEVEPYDSILGVGTEESGMGTIGELKPYEEEEAIANGHLDWLLYSPASICSSLSDTTELIAGNLDPVGPEIEGDINADVSSEVALEDAIIAVDRVEDGAVVCRVKEVEHPVPLQLEVNNKIGSAAELTDFGIDSSVCRIQAKPAVRRSLRLLKKSKVIGPNNACALDDWPKKKWIKRWMAQK